MKKILFVLLLFCGTSLLTNAQGKKHHHHDHHHGHKKKKKHHHDHHCHHHHHDYTYVIVDNPYEQAHLDMNTISINVKLSKAQKSKIEQAYLNFYLTLNKYNNLGEKERKKKCSDLEKKREDNIHNILNQNQFNLYASFIKTWN